MKPRPAGRYIALLFCAFSLITGGCKAVDDVINPSLPAETQEGKNTFGCKVNDALWLPYTEHTIDRALEPEYDHGWFTLRAERETGNLPYINLQLADSTGLHTKHYSEAEGFGGSVTFYENGQSDTYITLPGDRADITLTKAEPPAPNGSREVIISGTFSFVATSTLSGKKVTVTEGRFDLKAR